MNSWSRNGELLASGGSDRLVNIHTVYPDFALNTRIDTGHTEYIFSVKFMPHSSDRTILTAAGDAQVRIFDVEYTSTSLNSAANKSNRVLTPTSTSSVGQDFSFGGKIAARRDIVPLKWYSYAENQHRVYNGHTSRVKRIVTEENPYTFLTCSEDGTVRQWDLRQPSGFNARPVGSRTRGVREYYGMTVIDDKDRDGVTSGGAPPLISYRKWGIELNAISCSTSQPFYIGLGGRNLHCFLHDRRMSGRDLTAERGAERSSSSSSTASATAMDRATRCVRKFVPRPGSGGGRVAPHITSCKISDVHPDNILVSWAGYGIYMFSIRQSPEEACSGGDEQRKENWDPDDRRDRDASDPGLSSSISHGGGDSTNESIPKGLREPGHDYSSFPSFPPFSREGEGSEAEAVDQRHDRDQPPGRLFRERHPPTIAGLLTTLKQKLATLQTATSSPEAEEELANDILAAATEAYHHIRLKILLPEQRNFEFLTPTPLAESEAECRGLDKRRESARQYGMARDWVRAVGYYANEVLLGQVDDDEKDFEELEYTHDVRYRVFKLACAVAARGREGGVEVAREEQRERLEFKFGDDGDDGDGDTDEEGMLREYFTGLLINASPHPIQDLWGNTLYNSESDLITSLRTLIYSPPPSRTPHLKITFLPTLLLAICPPVYTSTMPSIYSTPSPPLYQIHHQPSQYTLPPTLTSHHSALCLGHANILMKDVTFLGQQDEYVVSGSDDGNFFIWDARSARIVNILAGGSGIVNVVMGHPRVPILAAAGDCHLVDIFGVAGGSTGVRARANDLDEIVARRGLTSGGWGC